MKALIVALLIFIVSKSAVAQGLPEKLIGVWELVGSSDKTCLVFINSRSGAITSQKGLLHYNFTFKLSEGQQPVLISEKIPIFSEKEDFYQGLIQLQNDSTLLLNNNKKGRNALAMKGKDVLLYRKRQDVKVEDFIRKPRQADLIGAWVNVFKKDTAVILDFKTNNVLETTYLKTNQKLTGIYNADFDKQPMTIDFINQKGEVLPNIFAFFGNDVIRFAGPKNGKRRSYFTFFGGNIHFQKMKL